MEIHVTTDQQIITPATGGKSWLRVITGYEESSFANKSRYRSAKGTLVDKYDLGQDCIFQISNGSEKKFYRLGGNTATELKPWEVHKLFPKPKTIKFTIEVNVDDDEALQKIKTLFG